MTYNLIIYLAYFMLTPIFTSAISFRKLNYDLRYANSDLPEWKQRACSKPQREKMNLHYICDDMGNVKCLPGWQGDLCQVPLCRKGCDPMNGYCQRPDECRCRIGYTGEFCERCIPLPGCQHGYCNKPFECICKPGWDGLFCTEPTCRSGCHSTRGYCEAPNECRCRLGWAGRTCSDCAVIPGCQHGTCQKPLECNCLPGYTGLLCQTAICASGCHKQRGYCAKPGECRCKVGWTGPNCNQCFPYPGCMNGDCERPWECNCKAGWGGMLCDEKLTYCEEHPNTCENGGRCTSLSKDDGSYRCECKHGYLGKNCEISDEFMLTSTAAPRITPPPMPERDDETQNNNDDDDEDASEYEDIDDDDVGSENQIAQNNTTTTSNVTAILTANNTLTATPQPEFNRAPVLTPGASIGNLTNLNDTKFTLASNISNNIKVPAAPSSNRNVSDVNVTPIAIEAKTTTTPTKVHLNLINASSVALKSHNKNASMPNLKANPSSSNILISNSKYLLQNLDTTTAASPTHQLTTFSSPKPIPLNFPVRSSSSNSTNHHHKITQTVAVENSNFAASPSGNNAANEVGIVDEYAEGVGEDENDDEDDDEDDDDDDDDDDEGDDENEDDYDEDQLIPDVLLNNVA